MSTLSDRPTLTAYRADIAHRETLTPQEERDLARRCREGDRDASRRLIEACLPFVLTIAFEYRRWGIPLEDIVQEGNIGLLKAAERYDPDRGCRLVTYAAYWIRAEIREYVVRGYRIVRLGSSKSERRALRIYRKTREQNPSALAALSGMTTEKATALLPLLMARDVSLEGSASAEGEGLTPAERIPSDAVSPEDAALQAAERKQMSDALRRVVDELTPREQSIVRWRWLTETPRTLEQLGVEFGISKERVRQIEERAKKRMRARLEEIASEPLARSA
jgi:RNA polymerase sigma-32 factor